MELDNVNCMRHGYKPITIKSISFDFIEYSNHADKLTASLKIRFSSDKCMMAFKTANCVGVCGHLVWSEAFEYRPRSGDRVDFELVRRSKMAMILGDRVIARHTVTMDSLMKAGVGVHRIDMMDDKSMGKPCGKLVLEIQWKV